MQRERESEDEERPENVRFKDRRAEINSFFSLPSFGLSKWLWNVSYKIHITASFDELDVVEIIIII